MEIELKELIKDMIKLKNVELNNLSMSCDAVEGFILGTFYEVQDELLRNAYEELDI